MSTLSVIVPFFDEKKALPKTISSLGEFYSQDPVRDIIFVDDGSADQSPELLISHAGPRAHVIRHCHYLGDGTALKTGLRKVEGDLSVITDAETSYPHSQTHERVDRLRQGEADRAVGARGGALAESGLRVSAWSRREAS